MVPKQIMVIAGEASGDILAAELVKELRPHLEQRWTYSTNLQPLEADLAPRFFGAGGPRMAEAGVELAFDMTTHAVVGLQEVLKKFAKFRRLFNQLLQLAIDREPDAIICVDFSDFNHRFAHAIKQYTRSRQGPFFDWNPKVIRYVSPQVWASREGRARQVAKDVDLLLSIFPFEKDWYAARVPKLRVEFVGHPLLDRYSSAESVGAVAASTPSVVLLPGSRIGELERHLPVMLEAIRTIKTSLPNAHAMVVLPSGELAEQARSMLPASATLDAASHAPKVQVGGLADALRRATIAIASTGTVTMECAYFGVPTVTLYKTSWLTYQIGKRVVKVKSLTMPNLLANEPVFPEFIQDDATPANIACAALELLRDEPHRQAIKAKLAKIIATLGGPGASRRAAEAIAGIL